MNRLLTLFIALIVWPQAVIAMPVVADISNYHIDIDAHFVGTKLFLFGTRDDAGDVVVVVRGPAQPVTVRKKEKIAGVWVNRRYVKFAPIPSYYNLASSRALESMPHDLPFSALKLSPASLFQAEDISSRKLPVEEFSKALYDTLTSKELYQFNSTLQFMGESLFKATLEFPSTLQSGQYTAEIYLLRENRVVGMHAIPITVKKVGAEAVIEDLAHQSPVLYGLLAIAMALCAGWLANHLFERQDSRRARKL